MDSKPLLRRVGDFLLRPRVYLGACFLVAAGTAVHAMLLMDHAGPWMVDGKPFSRWNNYVIFRNAWRHLVEHQDLYAWCLSEQWDLFKYSPTFAVAMAPFAWLPERPGFVLWNLLNAAVMALALRRLPGLDDRQKGLVVWFAMPEFLGASRNAQANVLMAGLMILAYAYCERERWRSAALVVALSVFVKPFGAVAGLLFLLYPARGRLVAWCAAFCLALLAVPLLVVSPDELRWQMGNWMRLLAEDHAASTGLSVAGWLQAWFGFAPDKLGLLAVAAALLLLPFLRRSAHADPRYRLMQLASILVWVVIFNHKAESPTFVIAMYGVGLWAFGQPASAVRLALAGACFLCTSIAYGDLVTGKVRARWVTPYVLKVAALVPTWARQVWELAVGRPAPAPAPVAAAADAEPA